MVASGFAFADAQQCNGAGNCFYNGEAKTQTAGSIKFQKSVIAQNIIPSTRKVIERTKCVC